MKQLVTKILISFLSILIFLFFYKFSTIGQIIELKIYDKKFDIRGYREYSKDIVIISIDEISMDDLGVWPWPRSYHAQIVDKLNSYGASAIGFDVIFSNLSRNINEDKQFAESIKKSGKVVLGSMLSTGTSSKISSSSINTQEALSLTIPEPYEEMLNGKINYGIVNVDKDIDGVIRTTKLLRSIGDMLPTTQTIDEKFEPSLNLQLLKIYDENIYNRVKEKYKDETILINFAGGPKTYKTISYSNLLLDKIQEIDENGNKISNKDLFKNKIVLIGATAEVLHDNHASPFNYTREGTPQLMPGVEIHAATLDTVINEIEYKKASNLVNITIITILSILATFLFIYLNNFIGLLALVSISIIYIVVSFSSFILYRYDIETSTPILCMLVAFSTIYSYRFFIEEREKRRVRNVFKRYMSPALVEEALKNPEQVPSLDVCNKKFITLFFSDIAGFTTMSEKFPPEEVKRILDEYLTAMTEIVFNNNGVVDKYIGDAIMAIYGSVYSEGKEMDAFRCVKTAIEMQEKMKELRQKWVSEGSIAMQIRIGIHSGEALVGNFGSPLKMDYTAIGDTVNTASRLEGLNKEFNTSIIISHSTYELVSNKVNVRNLGPAPVKGKSEALHVYEVLSISEEGKATLLEDDNIKSTRWAKSSGKETKWSKTNKGTRWN
ncbi:MAG: adenylate/guanylate cyclase domain-containing protein [Candidatus Sericytochromatia bacterium]|nr:MAG: adenylate/guanylate cyclase domain-containing protein [Candidatus Sericytochromatia bacterium]